MVPVAEADAFGLDEERLDMKRGEGTHIPPVPLRFLVGLALAGSLIGLTAAAWFAPAEGLAQAGGFELVGPTLKRRSSRLARGRTLNFLKHWNGAIYAGYGDYGTNTGPIAITPFALSTDQFAAQPAFRRTPKSYRSSVP